MGDFYKFKKILIILMIISCGFNIIKNIFKTHVEASEAVEVTPVWNDGSYTYQSDNQYLTLRQNQIDIQDSFITFLYDYLSNADEVSLNRARTSLTLLKNVLISTNFNSGYVWGGINTRLVWFSRVTSSVNNSNDYPYCFQILQSAFLNNIVYNDATLNNGYKILSVPFYSFTRNNTRQLLYFHGLNGSLYTVNSGDALIPVAEVGCYSTRWVGLFQAYGLLDGEVDYSSLLNSIEETNELSYTQAYYTRELVENTYNSINNSNVNTISSSGISQPEVTEPDLSDAFDSITNILTNDNATTKSFTFTLPNNDSFSFSLDPNFLRTSLTRVGGGAVVTIIETLWYIGLYGLFIFTYLKIIGALLAGDLDNITGVLSPVNSVVSSSLEVTGAFRTSGGDESAFRIRKG